MLFPSISADVMFAVVAVEFRIKFAKSRRRRWVREQVNTGIVKPTALGLTWERKFFGKAALCL